MRPRRWLAILLAVASGACAGGGNQPAPQAGTPVAQSSAAGVPGSAAGGAAGAVAAPAAAPVSLTRLNLVHATTSAANSVFQLAQEQGIFAQNGLEIEQATIPPTAVPAALVSGQAQVASVACAEMVQGVAGGADFVMLATSSPRMVYMLVGGPGVTRAEHVRGKRLAVSRLGSSSHLAAKFILRYIGLDPEDAAYLQVGGTPERVAALAAGSVDVSILSSDEGTLIGSQPGFEIIIDMSRENLPYCSNGLTLLRQYVQDSPEVVRRLTRAVVEAIARYKLNREESIQAVGNVLGETDRSKLEHLRDNWARVYPEKPYPAREGLQFVMEELADSDPRVRTLDPDRLMEPRFVRELDESGYIDGLYRPR